MTTPESIIVHTTEPDDDGYSVDVIGVGEDRPTAALVVHEAGADEPLAYLEEKFDVDHAAYDLPSDLWQLSVLAQAIITAPGFAGTVVTDASRDALFPAVKATVLANLGSGAGPIPPEILAGDLAGTVLRFLAHRDAAGGEPDLVQSVTDLIEQGGAAKCSDADVLAEALAEQGLPASAGLEGLLRHTKANNDVGRGALYLIIEKDRAEVARLQRIARAHEAAAASAADAGIGLFLEYRDVHGKDEDAARAAAVSDVHEGTQAITDIVNYEADERPPTLIGLLVEDGFIPAGEHTADQLAAAARCYAAVGRLLAGVPARLLENDKLTVAYEAAGKTNRATVAREVARELREDPLGTYYGRGADGALRNPSTMNDQWPWPEYPWKPADDAATNLAAGAELLNAAIVASANPELAPS